MTTVKNTRGNNNNNKKIQHFNSTNSPLSHHHQHKHLDHRLPASPSPPLPQPTTTIITTQYNTTAARRAPATTAYVTASRGSSNIHTHTEMRVRSWEAAISGKWSFLPLWPNSDGHAASQPPPSQSQDIGEHLLLSLKSTACAGLNDTLSDQRRVTASTLEAQPESPPRQYAYSVILVRHAPSMPQPSVDIS